MHVQVSLLPPTGEGLLRISEEQGRFEAAVEALNNDRAPPKVFDAGVVFPTRQEVIVPKIAWLR